MGRIIALSIVLICAFALAGCGSSPAEAEKVFSLDNGRYVIEDFEEESDVPYILIQGEWFTIVMNDGLSYQPHGKIEKNENEVIMADIYREEDCCWTFRLTDDNTFEFVADKSKTPDDCVWADGTKFIPEELFS